MDSLSLWAGLIVALVAVLGLAYLALFGQRSISDWWSARSKGQSHTSQASAETPSLAVAAAGRGQSRRGDPTFLQMWLRLTGYTVRTSWFEFGWMIEFNQDLSLLGLAGFLLRALLFIGAAGPIIGILFWLPGASFGNQGVADFGAHLIVIGAASLLAELFLIGIFGVISALVIIFREGVFLDVDDSATPKAQPPQVQAPQAQAPRRRTQTTKATTRRPKST